MAVMWKGTINFSLVSIAVQLHAMSAEHGLGLHLLHKRDMSPVRFARVCRQDGREIPWNEIVKGYEISKDDYVVIDQKELAKAHAKRTHSIEIVSFVDEKEVESYYFDKPYFLEPLRGAEKSYVLLREALKQSKKIGVAKVVFTDKEHLAALKVGDNVLMLNTLRFESDVRKPEIRLPARYEGDKKELDLALQLIGQMSGKFKPSLYKDSYTAEIKKYIERKAKGRPIVQEKGAEPRPTPAPDLLAALRSSLKHKPTHGESRTVH
jgi:DNA end-binding protein Ku